VSGVSGVPGATGATGIAGSIQINSTVFFFSHVLLFIFSSIHLSSYHISYLHICIFQKYSAYEQYTFRQEDVS
jgi:hypothetical protein